MIPQAKGHLSLRLECSPCSKTTREKKKKMMAAGFRCCFWCYEATKKQAAGQPASTRVPDPPLTRGVCLGHHFPSGSLSPTSLVAQMVKNLLQPGRPGFDPWVRKIPWRRKWLPTPVFLPGEFHGQRSLAGYSPRGHKESDATE